MDDRERVARALYEEWTGDAWELLTDGRFEAAVRLRWLAMADRAIAATDGTPEPEDR